MFLQGILLHGVEEVWMSYLLGDKIGQIHSLKSKISLDITVVVKSVISYATKRQELPVEDVSLKRVCTVYI